MIAWSIAEVGRRAAAFPLGIAMAIPPKGPPEGTTPAPPSRSRNPALMISALFGRGAGTITWAGGLSEETRIAESPFKLPGPPPPLPNRDRRRSGRSMRNDFQAGMSAGVSFGLDVNRSMSVSPGSADHP